MPGVAAPEIAVYRVVLRGAIESALYRHAAPTESTGRGFWGDPIGTWRGAEAEVVGPIITTGRVGAKSLARVYRAPALHLGPDIREVVAELIDREPAARSKPCKHCRYRTGHALDCPRCEPWWNPPGSDVWVGATDRGHEVRLSRRDDPAHAHGPSSGRPAICAT